MNDGRPVAGVYVDTPLPHLDRLFDYAVPEDLRAQVVLGSRVRVRFAGKLTDAYVIAMRTHSEHYGRLSAVERVIGIGPVLTEETTALIRAVADRAAGTFVDVARLAVPPRHAASEQSAPVTPPDYVAPDAAGWSAYGAGFIEALSARRQVRAVWSALPGEDWPARLAEAAAACAATGRGAVLVVPEVKDLARVQAALHRLTGAGGFAELTSTQGPSARYRRFLRCLRGEVRIAVGTRSAVFAPLPDVGLIAIWDDGDDLYEEPRAPYPHTRDIAVLRAHLSGASLLIGGFTQSVAATALLDGGWSHPLRAGRDQVRRRSPRITASGDDVFLRQDAATHTARMPTVAITAAKDALAAGRAVLVQVPRRGYLPMLGCLRCHRPARCRYCQGPLAMAAGDELASCRWCGRLAGDWQCEHCSARRMRAAAVGARRTAEEIGRMLPGVPVIQSAGDHVLSAVEPRPSIVIATPGAEPVTVGGYGAVLLLDGWALLSRMELGAREEALRRWMNAAALAAPAADGGHVVVMAPSAVPVIQSLVRWDAAWHAERELAERRQLRFPPAWRMAALVGEEPAISAAITATDLPASAELLGPVADEQDDAVERVLIRVPRDDGPALAAALMRLRSARSARKATDRLTIRMDPVSLL